MSSKAAQKAYLEAVKRRQQENKPSPIDDKPKHKTQVKDVVPDVLHDKSQDTKPDKYPEKSKHQSPAETKAIFLDRDEVQELSFHLRDDDESKAQAHIPKSWKGELNKLAERTGVTNLELYRFIFGEFLGKVTRKKGS